jgi:hypothetical protein
LFKAKEEYVSGILEYKIEAKFGNLVKVEKKRRISFGELDLAVAFHINNRKS